MKVINILFPNIGVIVAGILLSVAVIAGEVASIEIYQDRTAPEPVNCNIRMSKLEIKLLLECGDEVTVAYHIGTDLRPLVKRQMVGMTLPCTFTKGVVFDDLKVDCGEGG